MFMSDPLSGHLLCRRNKENGGGGNYMFLIFAVIAEEIFIFVLLICLQIYSPNYVLPPPKCCSDEMDMDLRYSWDTTISFALINSFKIKRNC
jgi:hypothetical protein